MKSIRRKDFIIVGTIAKTHGVKGEIRVQLDTPVKIHEWAFPEIREKPVPFYVEQVSNPSKEEAILKLQGIQTVEEAEKLVGYALLAPKANVKRKKKEVDMNLNGFLLIDEQAGEIGTIKDLQHIAKQMLFVVDYKGKEIMIPAAEDFITDIDEEQEIIYLDLPEGLMDL